ncbi:hypothetical protein K505DRAFT_375564 [Melanomma pulvis-pyrius CBS 109.77]|uniref:Uncharacterized protein n=1 Tax=Melanomma pulvis-pyrius CBS 109.77 TaxID=1314802 RepID=A0A6A6X973_9PLEO|nr:hypothetical protein K505DRAFT_375564 [Melanomma pulvis-pyrius CBS 109.77]
MVPSGISFRREGSSTSADSVSSFRTVDSLPASPSTGEFHLPTSLRQVVKQRHRTGPESLPDLDANYHEVRYFLYQILTVESNRVAKLCPQWVLETCASWVGTGAELRGMSEQELKKLCPLDAGHCDLDKGQKTQNYPPPDCRTMIGEIISNVVKTLKAKEDEKARLKREWRETQIGNSARQMAMDDCTRHQSSMELIEGYQRQRQVRRSSSVMSMPVLPERVAMPEFHELHRIRPERLGAELGLHTWSSKASVYPQVSTMNGPASRRSPSPGDESNSSDNTNSTTQTSPPASIEEEMARQISTSQEFFVRNGSVILLGPRTSHINQPAMRLRQVHHSASMPTLAGTERYRSTLIAGNDYTTQDRPPYDQGGHPRKLHIHPHNQHQYSPAPLTEENLEACDSRRHYRSMPLPRIICHESPIQRYTNYSYPLNSWQGVQDHRDHFENGRISFVAPRNLEPQQSMTLNAPTPDLTLPRPRAMGPPPGIPHPYHSNQHSMKVLLNTFPFPPVRSSSITSSRSSTTSSRRSSTTSSRRAPMNPNSMSYPRPDICGPRPRPTSTAPSTQPPRSIASSLVRRSPLGGTCTPQKRIPLLPTFTGPNRTRATSAVDTFSLESGAYTAFKGTASTARSEVVAGEVERMSGMVPSRLHGEGVEHNGPSVRIMDPSGNPYPTLVEQIRDREILDGKRQRGTPGTGVLKN